MKLLYPSLITFIASMAATEAFSSLQMPSISRTRLFSSTLQEIESMRASEIKKELESYGINTKAFLEKSELIDALKDARDKGLKPKKQPSTTSSKSTTTTSKDTKTTNEDRAKKLEEELKACQSMRVSELKEELKSRGVSTKALFEKSELVEALAKARVDGVSKVDDEEETVVADVEVITDDSAGPRAKGSKQQASADSQSPFSGSSPFGGSPFGGASPFGGMGGMGGMNMEDLMKGMGGFGGGSPFGSGMGGVNMEDLMKGMGGFGGMGGMGGMGDAMKKSQELMKNPKVREIIAKAQTNPSVMAKVNECLSNPASFSKYQNDPDVKELIQEIKKYM